MNAIFINKGLNMIAILVQKRNIYDCNLFQLGPNMIAMVEFFSRDSSRNHSHVTVGRISTLQAYLVPIERGFKIARIFGPHCDHDCRHI